MTQYGITLPWETIVERMRNGEKLQWRRIEGRGMRRFLFLGKQQLDCVEMYDVLRPRIKSKELRSFERGDGVGEYELLKFY